MAELNETLCIKCVRTGCDRHLLRGQYELLPKKYMPCCWITAGRIPKGCKYSVRKLSEGNGVVRDSYRILECPYFSPDKKN